MDLETSLRALRATLLLSLGALPACVGGSDGPKESGTDSGAPTSPCAGSTPILDAAGAATGFERCEDGTIHRSAALSTSAEIPLASCNGDEAYLSCTTDADCTGGPNGKCYHQDYVEMGGRSMTPETGEWDPSGCSCTYSCATDADCGAGQACVPGGLVDKDFDHATCEPAECRTDADCASGECGLSSYNDGCSFVTTLTCRDADDACRVDADCDRGSCVGEPSAGTYACETVDCAIGRPLLVEGRARVAADAGRADWAADLSPDLAQLDEGARLALGAWWMEVAALEHASVGSFARFTLQLLALGAPPELLADVARASADEVRHARLAYGLASAYLGAPVGPGPLSLSAVAIETDLRAVVIGLIEEAAVGETLGAAEARAAAEGVAEPALRDALSRVAEDEERHAALAWRALRWMLEQDPTLRSVAADTFEAMAARVREGAGPVTPDAPSRGVLSPRVRRQVHLAALEQVVLPCAALLKNEILST